MTHEIRPPFQGEQQFSQLGEGPNVHAAAQEERLRGGPNTGVNETQREERSCDRVTRRKGHRAVEFVVRKRSSNGVHDCRQHLLG